MVVEASFLGFLDIRFLAIAGKDNEHGISACRLLPKRSGNLVALDIRKPDIEENDVWQEYRRFWKSLLAAVYGFAAMTAKCKEPDERVCSRLVVVYHEYSEWAAHHVSIIRRLERNVPIARVSSIRYYAGTMRRSYVPGTWKLLVKRARAGKGLFAGEAIPKGACVIEYVGRTLSKEEADTSRSRYLFEISKSKTIDGKPAINKAGYINHACDPNCETQIHKGRVYIFSIKPIKEGEELTYDYGEEYVDEFIKPYGCRCESCMPSRA